jgi:hypothetical protein
MGPTGSRCMSWGGSTRYLFLLLELRLIAIISEGLGLLVYLPGLFTVVYNNGATWML